MKRAAVLRRRTCDRFRGRYRRWSGRCRRSSPQWERHSESSTTAAMAIRAISHVTNQAIPTERQGELIQGVPALAGRRATEGQAGSERERARNAESCREYERLRDQATGEFEQVHAALIAEYKSARE